MTDSRRIFYVCNWSSHHGGIKVLYDHVKLLREAGYDARLASYGRFERCSWFRSDSAETPAVSECRREVRPTDLVVVPELAMWDRELLDISGEQWVFVQNPDLMTTLPTTDRFAALLVPSEPVRDWLRAERDFAGPIHCAEGFLESDLVAPARDPSTDRPRVLVVDRQDKHRGEPHAATHALSESGVDVTCAQGAIPRDEFIRMFHDHDIYLHLSYREGFPISVLEAFGAGCLVIGFTGRGGDAFMVDGHNCLTYRDGDWLGVVHRVHHLPTLPAWKRLLTTARATARSFTEDRTRRALARAFETKAQPSPEPGAVHR